MLFIFLLGHDVDFGHIEARVSNNFPSMEIFSSKISIRNNWTVLVLLKKMIVIFYQFFFNSSKFKWTPYYEAVNLLSSNKYTEKQIGYLFISVLLNEGNDLIKERLEMF